MIQLRENTVNLMLDRLDTTRCEHIAYIPLLHTIPEYLLDELSECDIAGHYILDAVFVPIKSSLHITLLSLLGIEVFSKSALSEMSQNEL
jgi:hypothetical protein